MKTTVVKKDWGEEHTLVDEPTHCAKILKVKAGWQGSLHRHEKKDETLFVKVGAVAIEVDGRILLAAVDDKIRIPPGTVHRFTAGTNKVELMEVSSHHEQDDVVRDEPARQVTPKEMKRLRGD